MIKDKDVFINCPFDQDYLLLLQPMIFALIDLGFRPRCALESSNSAINRLDKILQILSECKYSIHDISYIKKDPITRLPRFNMPLELGLDIGCRKFGVNGENDKVLLVLDVEKYRYRNFISDIAGEDIYAHDNNADGMIRSICRWLYYEIDRTKVIVPGEVRIINRFQEFNRLLPDICNALGVSLDISQFSRFVDIASVWIDNNPIN